MMTHLPVVLFRHQGQRFALEAQYVRGQGQGSDLDDGGLTPFAKLLSPSSQAIVTAMQWLELSDCSAQSWRLGLEQPAELVELPVEAIHRLPSMLQGRSEFPALQALAWYQNELVALLSVEALFKLAKRSMAN